MAYNTPVKDFIAEMKKEKSQEEYNIFVQDLVNFGATALYTAIVANLTDEYLDELEKIEDDTQAEEEMKRRFIMRTGYTPEKFMQELHQEIVQENKV
jgi:hypothetical protein